MHELWIYQFNAPLKLFGAHSTGLQYLKGLTRLTTLELQETKVTDTGLKHLTGLTNLTTLHLLRTKVTAQGVADLKKALPECKIGWDGPK